MRPDISVAVPDAELATFSYRYAAALDRRDQRSLLTVFHPDATLQAHPPGRNTMTLTGHDQLAKLIAAVSYWPRTHHVVGQGLHQRIENSAFGETYCTAHHFSSSEPGVGDDYIMYIRYLDTYVCNADGDWLIMERVVTTDAVERRDVMPKSRSDSWAPGETR